LDDARAEAAEVVRVNPKYTIGAQKLVSILKRGDDSDHLIDGLRKAGLPE
jgi:adenylate cyclase